MPESAVHMIEQCMERCRFFDEGECAQFPCACLEFGVGLSRKKEKRRARLQSLRFDQQFQAGASRHPKVADHEIEVRMCQCIRCTIKVRDDGDGVSSPIQDPLDRSATEATIFDRQNPFGPFALAFLSDGLRTDDVFE